MFKSLRTRLIAFFSLLFAAIIVLIELVSIFGIPLTPNRGLIQQQREEAFRSLGLIADLKKERLLGWLEARCDDTHVAATNEWTERNTARLLVRIKKKSASSEPDADFWLDVRNDKTYKDLYDYLENVRLAYEVYNRIQIIEAATGTIVFSTDGAGLGDNASDHAHFIRTLKTGNAYVSDIEISHEGAPQPILHISHPIFDISGEPAAVLIMEVSTDDIIKPMMHSGEGLGERGEALLINQEVNILTSLKHPLRDGTWARPLDYRIKAKPAVFAARGEEGIIQTEDYRGEPVLAAYRHIRINPELGWGMVVKRDTEELFAPLWQDITYSIATGLLGILAVVALTVLIARGLTGPLVNLGRTADKVADGSLNARAEITTDDEVGELARTFNSMLDSIQQRTTELAAVNKELEAFSYSVSHDLRAPLRSMDGFSQILLEDHFEALDEEGRDYLGRIRAASQRMGKLIDDLLSLSRVTRSEMRREQVNLSRMARGIASDLYQTDPDRDVKIKITPGMVTTGDSHLLEIVIDNLLNNAWKFTQNRLPANVEFGYTYMNGETAYFVRDNGAGFDMAYAGKLFGAFQRLHTMSEFPGTGIGLATVQRIIHRHGGRIWAEGEVDKGATFYFTL